MEKSVIRELKDFEPLVDWMLGEQPDVVTYGEKQVEDGLKILCRMDWLKPEARAAFDAKKRNISNLPLTVH